MSKDKSRSYARLAEWCKKIAQVALFREDSALADKLTSLQKSLVELSNLTFKTGPSQRLSTAAQEFFLVVNSYRFLKNMTHQEPNSSYSKALRFVLKSLRELMHDDTCEFQKEPARSISFLQPSDSPPMTN